MGSVPAARREVCRALRWDCAASGLIRGATPKVPASTTPPLARLVAGFGGQKPREKAGCGRVGRVDRVFTPESRLRGRERPRRAATATQSLFSLILGSNPANPAISSFYRGFCPPNPATNPATPGHFLGNTWPQKQKAEPPFRELGSSPIAPQGEAIRLRRRLSRATLPHAATTPQR